MRVIPRLLPVCLMNPNEILLTSGNLSAASTMGKAASIRLEWLGVIFPPFLCLAITKSRAAGALPERLGRDFIKYTLV